MKPRDLIVTSQDERMCRVLVSSKEDESVFIDAITGAGDCGQSVKVESATAASARGVEFVRPDALNNWLTD